MAQARNVSGAHSTGVAAATGPDDSAVTLTARSVLASALLGQQPPELPVAHLVQLASLFGINENRARVALSRMAAAGEVSTDGSGRYRLGGHLLARQERQHRSRAGTTRPWTGEWRLVVITATGRPAEERSSLRRRLTLARLAEQREGVWLRPDNVELEPDPAAERGVAIYAAVPEGDPVGLAAALFDLEGWARRAEDLGRRLDALPPAGPADLAPGFELSAAVLRHMQADPLLPSELLPVAWPGPALRRAYDDWDRRYRRVLTSWGRSA
jgi:phenylacetic acid degradation operon negative regulatory protein